VIGGNSQPTVDRRVRTCRIVRGLNCANQLDPCYPDYKIPVSMMGHVVHGTRLVTLRRGRRRGR
jgi:hypothetical protein